ncbi:MAG: glycosyl hydrolase family 18 protein [Rikenellaceae bacterium]
MKKTTLLALLALVLASCSEQKSQPKEVEKIVLAYVTSHESRQMPDPTLMTHINYAFGVMNDSCDGVIIQNPEKLRKVVALKSQNPELKVMLSIGGWGAGGFSEMAIDPVKRANFVANCLDITNEFGLDGIDMDWEYPTSSSSGIHSDPSDTDNFTALIKELRAALGQSKLVTFASVATAKYVDFKAVEPYLDFINLMTYDISQAAKGFHHSPLYKGKKSTYSTEESVAEHIALGIPKEKIVVGVPFYGRGNTERGFGDFVNISDFAELFKDYELLWDDECKVPYYGHSLEPELIVCSFENEKSLQIKCQYIKDNNLRGVMYWAYGSEGKGAPLSVALNNYMGDSKN